MNKVKFNISRFNFAYCALISSLFALTPFLGIISIVYQYTGWKMPTKVAWALIGVGSVSAIIALVSSFGGVAIAPAVAKMIATADPVAL